jgi:hypothetical protein
MKKTIKRTVLTEVSKVRGGVTRIQLQQFIWDAQGIKAPFQYRQGYYCINIGEWVHKGLLSQKERGGKFKITPLGKAYCFDVEKFKYMDLKRKYDLLSGRNDRLRSRLFDTLLSHRQKEEMVRDLHKIINTIKKL